MFLVDLEGVGTLRPHTQARFRSSILLGLIIKHEILLESFHSIVAATCCVCESLDSKIRRQTSALFFLLLKIKECLDVTMDTKTKLFMI